MEHLSDVLKKVDEFVKCVLWSDQCTFDEIRQILRAVVAMNRVDALTLFIERGCDIDFDNNKLLRVASSLGYSQIVRLLSTKGKVSETGFHLALRDAISDGYREVVKILLQHGTAGHEEIEEACRFGRAGILRMLLKSHPYLCHDYVFVAAEYGHVDVLKILIEENRENEMRDYGKLILTGIENGHPKVVGYLLKKKPGYKEEMFYRMVRHGDLDSVQCMIDSGEDFRPYYKQALETCAYSEKVKSYLKELIAK